MKLETENKMIHGGDIYRNNVKYDFSVNINPFGIAKELKDAMHNAVDEAICYPDIKTVKLRTAIGEMFGINRDKIICGNGASEIFMALIRAINPKKVLIPTPSFYGYEYASKSNQCEIVYYPLKEEEGFALNDDFIRQITEDTDLIFVANPNNPTGKATDAHYLKKLTEKAKEKGVYLILDECFMDFCGEEHSMLKYTDEYDNLIIVRAFTKIFAIPGVRLGFMMCSNRDLLTKVSINLPEWNISAFATKCGEICGNLKTFIKETLDYVSKEKENLAKNLKELGLKVFDTDANFILIKTEINLYEKLLEKGFLIRNCENFKGLGKGYYRLAVKLKSENEELLKAIGECIEQN